MIGTTTAPPQVSLSSLLRSKFPETWLWEKITVGSSGETSVTKTVPDTMTSWISSAFAMSSNDGFGMADNIPKIIVRKDFFITLDAPTSIILGEEFLLQVTAFSYLPGRQTDLDVFHY
ncbi:murinoglobulin-1-like [Mya arenaria]|uniref:murinoglobulin-1-like n=1 Tax=Mya arenaria TaxID=6604 RepID=UPI0022E520B7|nr:murinoglobulin-1-like [Mya arenaria]